MVVLFRSCAKKNVYEEDFCEQTKARGINVGVLVEAEAEGRRGCSAMFVSVIFKWFGLMVVFQYILYVVCVCASPRRE